LYNARLPPRLYHRNDTARSIFRFFRVDPDFYLAYLTTDQETSVALDADNMIGDFFASDGTIITDGNNLMRVVFGTDIWQKPTTLTETLNF
jgi:hypothetical protein